MRKFVQLQRDHQRDLELRLAGYIVLRYTTRRLIESPAAVAADLHRILHPALRVARPSAS